MLEGTETRTPNGYDLAGDDWQLWSEGAEAVEVAPDIYVPTFIRYEHSREALLRLWDLLPTEEGDPGEPPHPGEPLDVEYVANIRLANYRYVLRSLEVTVHGDEGVTATTLRDFKVGGIVGPVASGYVRIQRAPGGPLEPIALTELGHGATDKPTDETLKVVGRLYAVGHAIQWRPTAAVQESLKLKRSTADNWVRRAKDKGYVFAEA